MVACASSYVAVPTRGLVDFEIAAQIAALAERLDTVPVYVRGHLSAGMNRNVITHQFLLSTSDTLVMVDDDVWPADLAYRLVDRLEDGWDVVAGVVPVFKPDHGWPLPVPAVFRDNGDTYELVQPKGDDVTEPVDAVGLGCVAIHRRVFDTLGPTPFREEMHDGDIVSDDFVFSHAARKAGLRVGVDWGVRCDHLCRVSLGLVLKGAQQAQARSRIVLTGG